MDEENTTPDHLSPPLHYLLAKKSESSDDNAGEAELKSGPICTIIAKMDRAHPLTEAKWVRTGNADDWIQSVIGNGHNANVIGNNNKHSTITGGKATQQLPKGEQGRNNNNNNNNNDSPHNNAGNVKDGLEDDKNVTRESAWKGKIRVVDPDAVRRFFLFHHLSRFSPRFF